jgi:AraC family transcriptional regulator
VPKRSDPVSLGSPRFRTADHGGFLVSDIWFPAGLVLPPHHHDRTVVAVTLGGGWDSVMDGRPRESTPGMLLTEPAGQRHGNHFGTSGARVLIVQPDPVARADTLRACGTLLAEINHVRAPLPHTLARRLSAEIRYPDATSPLAIEALALELLAAAARVEGRPSGRGRPPLWLRRVIDYLQAHILDPPDLGTLAGIAGVAPSHLVRAFRRHKGVSLSSYSRRLRLDWAAERLAATDAPIAEIALAAGFADQSHFTRVFRRQLGTPPAGFRRSTRLEPPASTI